RRIGILRQIADAFRILLRRPFSGALFIEQNIAAHRMEHARNQFQQRRLPRSVLSRECDERAAAIDAERNSIDGIRVAVRIRHAIEIEFHRSLRSSDRKNGTPRSAVNAPTGSSTGAMITRETRSDVTSNAPPASAQSGSRYRKSRRQTRRTRCGTSSPMNPMMPATATAAPV